MPGIHKRRDTWVSSANSTTDNNDNNEGTKKYCVICESYGFRNKLGSRIYTSDEKINGKIPADVDNWLMCENGHIVAQVHAKQESSIVGIKDITDYIYDTGRLKIEHFIEPRRNKNRRGQKIHKDSTALPGRLRRQGHPTTDNRLRERPR